MAPATCSPEPRPPRPDASRRWIALGFEASSTVAGSALLGWWLSDLLGTRVPLVVCCLAGVAISVWLLLKAASP